MSNTNSTTQSELFQQDDDRAGYPRYHPKKTCLKCQETKPLTDFRRRSGPKTNYRNICQMCRNERNRVWRTSEAQRAKSRERSRRDRADPEKRKRELERRKHIHSLTPKNVFKLAVFNARKRAIVSVTEEELMVLWLKQDKRCALSGVVMTWGHGRIEPTSMSIDRINQDEGYTLDNVRLVCHAANAFRGRMTDAEMLAMAKAIVAHMEPVLKVVS